MLVQFFLALSVVLPLFIIMLVGNGLKRLQLIDDHTINQLNQVTFGLFLPLQLFLSVYQSNLQALTNVRVIVFLALSLVAVFTGLLVMVPIIEKSNARRGVIIASVIRCNYLIIGLPIMSSLFLPEQMGLVALILTVSMLLVNPMAIIAMEVYRNGKNSLTRLLISVLRNSFVIAPLIGILCLILHIKLPMPITAAMQELGKLGTPLALILLGASFQWKEVRLFYKPLLMALFLKLLLIPIVILLAARSLHFSLAETTALVIFYGAPTAVSTYPLAVNLDGDSKLSQEIIVASTLVSAVSLVILIVMIQSFFQ